MIATVYPPEGPLRGVVDPPSSKNFTLRYVLASALSTGRSIVRRPAVQDDAVSLVRCLSDMGAEIQALDAMGRPTEFSVENGANVDRLEIHGFGRNPKLRDPSKPLNPNNAGAVLRTLLAVSALLPEVTWITDFPDSLGKRPNSDLLDALMQLGVEVEEAGPFGALPIKMHGGLKRIQLHLEHRKKSYGLEPEDALRIRVSGEISSQYTSALLFLIPLLDFDIELHVTGRLKSVPLINTTRSVLGRAGITVESSDERHIHRIRAGQAYNARTWETNGDWPGSSAILAAAAVVPGSELHVERLFEDEQGEKECIPFYEKMGCEVRRKVTPQAGETLVFRSPANNPLQAAAINGDLCTDAVLAMMGAALAAEGNSRFVQIRNLQFKECDRVREPIEELRKVYATALKSEGEFGGKPPEKAVWFEPDDDPDTIHVDGAPQGFEGGIDVHGRGDHRVIMLLSIAALQTRRGLRIHGAEHVSKSFPGWFDFLKSIGVRVELEGLSHES